MPSTRPPLGSSSSAAASQMTFSTPRYSLRMSSASAFVKPQIAAFVQHHVLGGEQQRALPVGVHRATLERDGCREVLRALVERDHPAGRLLGRLGVVAAFVAPR